jgi:hypothetical protein
LLRRLGRILRGSREEREHLRMTDHLTVAAYDAPLIVLVTTVCALLAVSDAAAQTWPRPKWTRRVSFPNGGRHT